MNPVFYIADGLVSPLGYDSEDAYKRVAAGISAISAVDDNSISNDIFYGAILQNETVQLLDKKFENTIYTFLEKMCIAAIEEALSKSKIDISSSETIIIFSSTKGNIEWINQLPDSRIQLHATASLLASHFKNPNQPLIISTACISGTAAFIMAKRLLQSNQYKHAVVIGADRLSSFVLAGFKAFQAIAPEPCRPFDKERKGINLGEAAACVILSNQHESPIVIAGGGLSNDANHLSGPSRTGDELAFAINQALQEAKIANKDIEMISAHGTATAFNDEMESKALFTAGVSHAPLHSLKSYVGHTLGAAGIIESIMACKAMQQEKTIRSLNFEESGVTKGVNVAKEVQNAIIHNVLKTASGFGGCNAAVVWSKLG